MDPRLLPPARLARSVLHTQSDERLVELAGAGAEAAFEALVARHRRSMVRRCAWILGPADAEEAVQEALVRAHAALLRGDPVHCARPWLHAIARNTALNLLRTRTARAEAVATDADTDACVDDQALDQRLELNEVIAAVGALPERQREAIVMREFEGRSYVEIADRIGSSPGAVRQLLSRARTTMRKRLAALLPWGWLGRGWLADGGGAGSRVGSLPETCAATAKVCAALLPAAGLGAAGVPVRHHPAPVRHHPPPVRHHPPPVRHHSPPLRHHSPPVRPQTPRVRRQSAPARSQTATARPQTAPARPHRAPARSVAATPPAPHTSATSTAPATGRTLVVTRPRTTATPRPGSPAQRAAPTGPARPANPQPTWETTRRPTATPAPPKTTSTSTPTPSPSTQPMTNTPGSSTTKVAPPPQPTDQRGAAP